MDIQLHEVTNLKYQSLDGPAAGAEAGTGAAVANISGWEADRLLALVYYHVIPGQPSPAALAAAGTADTYLDQLTSGGETLSFSGDGSRVRDSHSAVGVVCSLCCASLHSSVGTQAWHTDSVEAATEQKCGYTSEGQSALSSAF